MIASVNPATGELLRQFPVLSAGEVDEKLALAAAAFGSYRRTAFSDRARWMRRTADLLEAETDRFARLMTVEMGKPVRAAGEEVRKCAWVCRYYADHAERFLADERIATDAAGSWVRYEPLGPVLAVMPWNFPFWQVLRFAAPALMAGNVGLLKHASNVPQCALAIEEVFARAGMPPGAFQTLLIASDAVGGVLDDPRVAGATLTGSERAGSSVAARAAQRIKKTVLELGGSDPFIVMTSARLDEAVATAVKARTINSGQSCIAAKRFIIAERIADRFERAFVAAMERLRVGDPLDPSTDVGPLATAAIRDELEEQVRATVAAGARVLTGGRRRDGPGNFYLPTVLRDVPEGTPAYRDELFGPVAALFRARDAVDAIRIANDTSFGLGSSVWTSDAAECALFVQELQAGQVFVNAMVASDPRLPFGGVKRSGYGRELGVHGIREFVNVKTVWIGRQPGPASEGPGTGSPKPDTE